MRKYSLILFVVLVSLISLLSGCVYDPLEVDLNTRNIYPITNNIYDIGSPLLYYNEAFINNLILNGITFTSANISGVGVEVDPVWTASDAFGITAADRAGWTGHPPLTTGIHGVGAGNVTGTTLTQELTNKTLTSSVGKGTWTASGTWKLPAMFFNGDITTDRWLSSTTNTFLGVDVAGNDALSHTGGFEGLYNTGVGSWALHNITTGQYNTAVGDMALASITTGTINSAFGEGALIALQDGAFNTGCGADALASLVSGDRNTACGMFAGDNCTGSGNVFMGFSAGYYESGSNTLYIDNSDTITPLIYGNFNTDDLHLFAATRIGLDNTNYSYFDDNGVLTMAGSARVDKDVEIPLTAFGKGVAAPATIYIGNYIGYEYTIGDTVYYSTEVPYDWDSTSDLGIELHWYIDEAYATAPNGEIRWNLIYTATREDDTETVDAATTTIDSGDINIPAIAKHLVQIILVIPAAGLQAHDVIGVQIKRVALVGGNNPTAKPTLIGALIEYTSNKLGE